MMTRTKPPKKVRYVYYYLITNLIDGRQYVGSRFQNGLDPAVDGYYGSSAHLKKDMERLGVDNFTKEILAVEPFVDKMTRGLRESKFMNQYQTLSPRGYNQYDTGRRPGFSMSGVKKTEEQCAKVKAAQNRPEVKAKNSAIAKIVQNRPEVKAKRMGDNNPMRRPEVKAKNSAAQKIRMNKPRATDYMKTPEYKDKMSAAQKIVQNRPEVKAKRMGDNNPMRRPEVKARHKAAMKKAMNRPGATDYMKTPEYKDKISAAMKSPEYRAKQMEKSKKNIVQWFQKFQREQRTA